MSNKYPKMNEFIRKLRQEVLEDKRQLIQFLLDKGYTYEEIGEVMGVSRQRVHNFMCKGVNNS